MGTLSYRAVLNCGDFMAELNYQLRCKKNGYIENIYVYTTLIEVENQGINIKINGIDGYMKYGAKNAINASQLNCKVNGEEHRVHLTNIPPAKVTIICFDVETSEQITAVTYYAALSQVLYLNNTNAPVVDGYDFVMMDGIKYSRVEDNDVFTAWYVKNTIPDNVKKDWTNHFTSQISYTPTLNTFSSLNLSGLYYGQSMMPAVKRINTYLVTDMSYMFYDCSSIISVPEMDTSMVTDMSYMFYGCSSLTSIPKIDTYRVTDMSYMFYGCSSLEEIEWEIDMSVCQNCDYMFEPGSTTKVKITRVPMRLDLSKIGTSNYTIVSWTLDTDPS